MAKTEKEFAPPQSTARWMQATLRRAIIEMELLPGVRLSEQELAARYAVSRQPVREAMISLANDNMVDIRPQRGTFVSHLSLERMLEARVLREAIEVVIIKHACRKFDALLFSDITTNIEIQRVHAKAGNSSAFHVVDAEFHALLARGAGFPHAWDTIQNLRQHTDRICKLTLASTDIMLALVEQHAAIFEAVRDRSSAEAVRLMRHHLTDVVRSLPDIKRRFPQWFD